MSKIIGIDLGTGFSCVSVLEGGQPIVIANLEGSRTTPSVISFTDKGERLVGQLAKRQAVTNPKRTVYAVKRLIGRKYDSEEVQRMKREVPYEIFRANNGDAWIRIDDKEYSPQQISAMILSKMKETAENYLGEEVKDAVITVPAYFNDSQRQATKDAGRIAGLNVLRIVNEPTAASLAYGIDSKEKERKIIVTDIGCGTTDVSILEISDGVFEVVSTAGDTFLGGEDFDNRILNWLIDEFKKSDGIDLSTDPLAIQRLKEAAEKAKCELSTTMETNINLPFITADANGAKHLNVSLSRAKFESLTSDLIEKIFKSVKIALSDAKLTVNDIDECVLVGGMTRMPMIQREIKKFFGKEPFKGVNPDEVVAQGAAIQGGVIGGDVSDVLLLDVCPLSLGIETLGGAMTVLIPRNTTVPTKKTEIFSTAVDSQPSVSIRVFQGERSQALMNKLLGEFELTNIPPAPRGVPKIEVTFEMSSESILSVSAKDLGTGRENHIEIKSNGGLSDDEINRMVKEAEEFRKQDEEFKKKVELKNNAEMLINTTEKSLREYGDKLSAEDKTDIETKLSNLKNALTNDDSDIQSKIDELQRAVYKIAEIIYKSTAQQNNQQTDTQQSQQTYQKPQFGNGNVNFDDLFDSMNFGGKSNVNKNDDVVDADFRETK